MIGLSDVKCMNENEARDLNGSHLWEAVVRELNYRILGKMLMLKSCDEGMVKDLQNQIKVYEEVIALPEGVINRENKGKT